MNIRVVLWKKAVSGMRSLFREEKLYLGRWGIHSSQYILHRKIDYANEDHCGVCTNGKRAEEETTEEEDEYIRYML